MIKKSDDKMGSLIELLELRKQIKSKKPNFIRQDIHKKKRLGRKWRRPKGLHSKVKMRFRGRAKRVSAGYRSPKKVRYLHKSGLQQRIISSVGDLKSLDSKENCLIISSSMGNKKRISVLRKAKELGFGIVNIKNIDEYIKKVEEKFSSKRKKKAEGEEKAEEVKAEKKEEKLTEKIKEEDIKNVEKKEKDKLLTKRGK